MCVIMVADKGRPTDDQVERAFTTNSDGAGVAWREKGEVRWEKGLQLEDAKEYCRDLPLPFIAHFRIATCGGKIPELTHPFPVHPDVSLDISGSMKGFLLFHNGHWTSWKTELLTDIKSRKLKVPPGKWSDSRAIAWMAAYYDLGILDIIAEKTAVIGPELKDLDIWGVGWSRVGPIGEEILVSNKLWETYGGTQRHFQNVVQQCRIPSCIRLEYANSGYCYEHQVHVDDDTLAGVTGGASAKGSFREGTNAVRTAEDQQQRSETGKEGIREGTKEGKNPTALVLVNREELQGLRRWACSLNPKGMDPEKQKRIEAARNGNQVVGPI